MMVNGVDKAVQWGDAKHGDCSGKILSVDPTVRGKVKLDAIVHQTPNTTQK